LVIASPPSAAPSGPRSAPPPRRRPGEFGSGGRKFTPRRKVCQFCVDKIKIVDYKDLSRLRRFLSERGKIEPRRKTGTCAAHQRSLNVALKRARELAMLPFTAEHIRITGVPAREPGASPYRGSRGPRPGEGTEEPPAAPTEAAAEAPATEAPATEAPATDGTPVPSTNGAAPATSAPAAESPPAVAEAPAAQGTSAEAEPTTSPTTAPEA